MHTSITSADGNTSPLLVFSFIRDVMMLSWESAKVLLMHSSQCSDFLSLQTLLCVQQYYLNNYLRGRNVNIVVSTTVCCGTAACWSPAADLAPAPRWLPPRRTGFTLVKYRAQPATPCTLLDGRAESPVRRGKQMLRAPGSEGSDMPASLPSL